MGGQGGGGWYHNFKKLISEFLNQISFYLCFKNKIPLPLNQKIPNFLNQISRHLENLGHFFSSSKKPPPLDGYDL
jgi:hypothetical protein